MNKIIAMLLIAFSMLANAKPVMEAVSLNGHHTIVLNDDACINKGILEQVKPEFHKQMLSGTYYRVGEKTLEFCWIPRDDKVYILDEEGDGGVMPQQAFVPVKTT